MQEDQITKLSDVIRRNRSLQKGESAYHAGERFTGIFALKSGTAKLIHTDRLGNESIISVLLPGELIGFDGLSSGKYLCSLTALETSSYCELPANDMEQLSQRLPILQKILLQRTGEQYQHSIQRMVMGQRPADERMAAFLLDIANRYRVLGFHPDQFTLSLTRQDIGNHLGLALETVSRLMSKFESLGTIRVQGKEVHIVDAESLRRLGRISI